MPEIPPLPPLDPENKLAGHHDLYPVCFICNLYIAPGYLPTHLKADHSKEELAQHLLLVYLDEWIEEWEAVAESLCQEKPAMQRNNAESLI